MHTDAEMLDWVIRNNHYKVMGSEERGYVVWDCSNGLTMMNDPSWGKQTYRQAIDEAMRLKPGYHGVE